MRTRPIDTVIIDTSFILALLKNHEEFYEEIRNVLVGPVRIATTDGVRMELQRLARSGTFETAGLARVALEILETRQVEIRETSPSIPDVDASIVAAALSDENQILVATVDQRLKNILFRLGLRAISPGGRRGLLVLPGSYSVPLK